MTAIDTSFERAFEEMRAERAGLRADMRAIRADLNAFRAEMRAETVAIRGDMSALQRQVSRILLGCVVGLLGLGAAAFGAALAPQL